MKKIAFIILTIVICNSCSYYVEKLEQCDKMELAYPLHKVADSIEKMEKIVRKNFDLDFVHLFIDGQGNLLYNGMFAGDWDEITSNPDIIRDKVELSKLDYKTKRHTIRLLSFLIENNIYGFHKSRKYNILMFNYCSRDMAVFEREDRYIVLSKSDFDIKNDEYRVVKRTEELLLVATIYEN